MFKVSALFVLILTLTIVAANAQVYGGFPQRSSPSVLPSPSPVTPLPGVPVPAASATAQPAVPTFGDRVTQCMQTAGAAGYGVGDVAGYTRACANSP
jgi:hypothetical protein